MSFTASNIDFEVKPLFSFALRKGETSAFSLPVGATDIFKRSLRGLKTAKTRAWVRKPSEKQSRKFRSSLFKGLWVSRGQSPSFAQETDIHTFSQLLKLSCLRCSAQRNPKYCPKSKSVLFGSAFKGATSLAGLPLFGEQSPGLFPKFTPCRAHYVKELRSLSRKLRKASFASHFGRFWEDPKIYILSVRKALPYSIKYTRFSDSLP